MSYRVIRWLFPTGVLLACLVSLVTVAIVAVLGVALIISVAWPAEKPCWTAVSEGSGSAVDGDTLRTPLQIWPKLWIEETIRVLDIDTWELRRNDDRGDKAGEFTQNWIDKGPFTVYACKRDAFGRLLAVVKRGDEVLADELRKHGHEKDD